jgi:hypothetical protein
MRFIRRFFTLGLVMFTLVACASAAPPTRLGAYLGDMQYGTGERTPPVAAQMRAGLIVVADTSAPDAAPGLPDEAVNRVGESLRDQINQFLPSIRIESLVAADGLLPGESAKLMALAAQHSFDYLAVAVLSSTEQEYPMTVFLGWTSHSQPGYRRDNWSLAELALLDAKTGHVVLRAEGRAMATLDRPTAPGINQWYPVIYLRPQDPERRIWPPTYVGAPNTLRVVAMNQAVKRLVINLQDAWIQKREIELSQTRS